MRLFLLAVLALSAAAVGQTERFIAYPQDTLTHDTAHVAPFGTMPIHLEAEEARWQQLIPGPFLPKTPGRIVGMAAQTGLFAGTVHYRTLSITLSLANRTALSTTFAANLPSPVNVYHRTSANLVWGGAWTSITFDQPFAYDGTSDLVLEIRKECTRLTTLPGASHKTDGNPGRADLPRPVFTWGPTGSGAANRTTGAALGHPLQLRLLWGDGPTMHLVSDRMLTSPRHVFALGRSMDSNVDATPGSAYLTLVDAGFSPPFTVPQVIGIGCVLPAAFLPPGLVPASGRATPRLLIPPDPRLISVHLALQSVVLDVGLGGSLYFTNGCDLILNTDCC